MARDDFIGEIRDGVAWAIFNRPESNNAWSEDMGHGLSAFLAECEQNRNLRGLVLTGAGRHFMVGGDLKIFAMRMEASSEERETAFSEAVRTLAPIVESLNRCSFPILASVRGICAGLGFGLVLNCDMVIAADDAVFDFAYTRIGATPDGGASILLPRVVGRRRAMQIALFCDRLPAEEAERFGLVNWVVPEAELDARSVALAHRLAVGPRGAMARTKALLRTGSVTALGAGLEAEALAFGACAAGTELSEGIRAFLEKRAPRWSDP